ncbi:hypothetical protein D3C86_1852110 [compost metagenome]
MLGAFADQAVEQAVGELRQTRPVTVEKEHQHQTQGQLQHATAKLRTTCQQPVADLAEIRFEGGEERRALLVDGLPEPQQAPADQWNIAQPVRRRRQAGDLVTLE